MPRLYLFAEGQTEQTFASKLLEPHLANFGVFLHPPVLVAHARKKGKAHRGGAMNYLPMANDIRRFFAQEKSRDVFFTTMIDLYAIYRESPGLEDGEKIGHLPYQQVEMLEAAFRDDLGDTRFVPYIQLHEYEAYLFADPSRFRDFYGNHEPQIAALIAIVDECGSPEMIDGGSTTAPSKRILALFPDYNKVVVGTEVAALIGLQTIRDRCPNFNRWLTALEQLGHATPDLEQPGLRKSRRPLLAKGPAAHVTR